MYRLRLDGREVFSGPDYRDAMREFYKWRDGLATDEVLILRVDDSALRLAAAWGPTKYLPRWDSDGRPILD